MIFGTINGLVNGTEQIVFDREITVSAVSSIDTGNILNGNEDGIYTIIFRYINVTSDVYAYMRFNGDTGNNYGRRMLVATNTTVSVDDTSGESSLRLTYANGRTGFVILKIYANSGTVRLGNMYSVIDINGTSVLQFQSAGTIWGNTSDNIVSLSIFTAGTNIAVGSRVIILKDNNFTDGMPSGVITTPYISNGWVRVSSQTLGSAASSVTLSDIDGDTNVAYYLSCSIKATGNLYPRLRINADTGTNYGNQVLSANNTTVRCSRNVNDGIYLQDYVVSANGEYHHSNTFIFAKQGFIRPIIYESAGKISGTTVNELEVGGASYNVTNTNITSLTIFGAQNFDVGSRFDLYALYK